MRITCSGRIVEVSPVRHWGTLVRSYSEFVSCWGMMSEAGVVLAARGWVKVTARQWLGQKATESNHVI